MVKVHYDEGLAIHIGPESCAGHRYLNQRASVTRPMMLFLLGFQACDFTPHAGGGLS
jgi:hypothetical protein